METLMRQVTDSIFEVMETMFYLAVEQETKNQTEFIKLKADKTLKACRITFSGTFSGEIMLFIPLGVLQAMTRNFMGQDLTDYPGEYIEGTLKEALNMIAGNALTKADHKSYMGLGIPEIISMDAVSSDQMQVIVNTQEGPIAAMVKLRDQAA